MKNILLLLFFLLKISIISAQTGCILDSATYMRVPLSAPLMRGSYQNLPKEISLKKYCPEPRQQGDYGTCVGWTVAYMARTITLAQKNNWTTQAQITENALSPYFLYENIKAYDDQNCQGGATLFAGLEIMKRMGTVPFKDFGIACNQPQSDKNKEKALQNCIKDYRRLFSYGTKDKTEFIKKSLSDEKPVLVGIRGLFNSFVTAKDSVWKPSETDKNKDERGHALTVIGYNDVIGAFEVMNSWGTKWANKGFIWVKYEDFNAICMEAYELIIQENNDMLAGELSFMLSAGLPMDIKLKSANQSNEATNLTCGGNYEVQKPLRSGTLFRLYLSNPQPAYVYIFSVDENKKTTIIFPYNNEISPFLAYKSNKIALPSENHYIEFDNAGGTPSEKLKGTEYYCVLYSRQKLHLSSILESLKTFEGDLGVSLKKVLGAQLIPQKLIEYVDNEVTTQPISFKTNTQFGNILPIIVAIKHQ